MSWLLAHCSARGDKASKHSWLISELILVKQAKERSCPKKTEVFLPQYRGDEQIRGLISFVSGGYEVIPSSRENMRLLKRSSGSCGIFSGKISQMKVMSL